MGHSYTSLFCHAVFSTKQRLPLLDVKCLPELSRVVSGILTKRKSRLLALNGTQNHVHLLGLFHPVIAVSDMLRNIKAISSEWIHEHGNSAFAWQSGYGAFSVSPGNLAAVERYIAAQQEHHRHKTFEEEFVELLQRAGVEYDPRFVLESAKQADEKCVRGAPDGA